MASKSGRPANELVEDAMAAYLGEASEIGARLDDRYEEFWCEAHGLMTINRE